MQEQSFRWTFQEFEKHERSVWWYVIAGLVVALLVVYSVASNNFLFTVITVITVVVIFARQMQEPASIECEVTDDGIFVGKKKYAFSDLDSFSLLQRDDGVPVLYLHESRGMHNMVPIPMVDCSPESVRMFLRDFLEENGEHQQEPILDWLMRALKL
ncbi:MAG: hypothetical protein Q8P56_04685 [Candidatus Uhrbacteria bacterium]|nr:hypothetical protein [Candidatus Uhrbacteria bacterium]